MAGRGCRKDKACHCHSRRVDHPDGMMKYLFSQANSNRKHGTVSSSSRVQLLSLCLNAFL
jgi:hypothetical protein